MRSRFVMLAVAFGLAATACGGTKTVATVNGSTIGFDQVISLITEEDTIPAAQFTQRFTGTLFGLIADRAIVDRALAEFGITRTDAEIEARIEELVGPLLEGGMSLEELLLANNTTPAGLNAIASQAVMQGKVQDELARSVSTPTDDDLRQSYQEVLMSEASVCSAHILVESEEEAQAVVDRALAGEVFADLAVELSTGPSGPGGGDLGCSAPSQFVAEFADATLQAEVGVPFGPVRTSFGWHVILVTERTAPAFDELREELVAGFAAQRGQELWTAWVDATLETADVVVDPEYGTWTTDPSPNIIPPPS